MKYTGKIIVLAFPETFVRFSDEWISKWLPYVGLGKNGIIKAGHAALVLIENNTGNAFYYDFGRYVTPQGYGRVRSAETDAELEIPFKARISENDSLENLDEFLFWLEANPDKTHGNGAVIASVCNFIDFRKAQCFILQQQEKGSIPYRTFTRTGSNCSRIVTDTLLAATDKIQIRKPLLRNKVVTPSPLGNVEKAGWKSAVYAVINGRIQEYNQSAIWTTIKNIYGRTFPPRSIQKNVKLQRHLQHAHQLSGVGSNAFFKIDAYCQDENIAVIIRYNEAGKEDFRGVFGYPKEIKLDKPYRFIHDSHCKFCHVEQNSRIYRLDLMRKLSGTGERNQSVISLAQMEHSI